MLETISVSINRTDQLMSRLEKSGSIQMFINGIRAFLIIFQQSLDTKIECFLGTVEDEGVDTSLPLGWKVMDVKIGSAFHRLVVEFLDFLAVCSRMAGRLASPFILCPEVKKGVIEFLLGWVLPDKWEALWSSAPFIFEKVALLIQDLIENNIIDVNLLIDSHFFDSIQRIILSCIEEEQEMVGIETLSSLLSSIHSVLSYGIHNLDNDIICSIMELIADVIIKEEEEDVSGLQDYIIREENMEYYNLRRIKDSISSISMDVLLRLNQACLIRYHQYKILDVISLSLDNSEIGAYYYDENLLNRIWGILIEALNREWPEIHKDKILQILFILSLRIHGIDKETPNISKIVQLISKNSLGRIARGYLYGILTHLKGRIHVSDQTFYLRLSKDAILALEEDIWQLSALECCLHLVSGDTIEYLECLAANKFYISRLIHDISICEVLKIQRINLAAQIHLRIPIGDIGILDSISLLLSKDQSPIILSSAFRAATILLLGNKKQYSIERMKDASRLVILKNETSIVKLLSSKETNMDILDATNSTISLFRAIIPIHGPIIHETKTVLSPFLIHIGGRLLDSEEIGLLETKAERLNRKVFEGILRYYHSLTSLGVLCFLPSIETDTRKPIFRLKPPIGIIYTAIRRNLHIATMTHKKEKEHLFNIDILIQILSTQFLIYEDQKAWDCTIGLMKEGRNPGLEPLAFYFDTKHQYSNIETSKTTRKTFFSESAPILLPIIQSFEALSTTVNYIPDIQSLEYVKDLLTTLGR